MNKEELDKLKEEYESLKEITPEEIWEVLNSLTDDKEDFKPRRFFPAILKNKEFDPENFSEEIENSEEEEDWKALRDWELAVWSVEIGLVGSPDALSKFTKKAVKVKPFENSERWKQNHSKKCFTRVVYGPLLMACSMKKVYSMPDENGNEIKYSEVCRGYNYQECFDRIWKFVEEQRAKGEIVIRIG